MLSQASVGAKKIVFVVDDGQPNDDQNGEDTDDNSNGDDDNSDSGITNSPSDQELNSELMNTSTWIYIGISTLTVLCVAFMFLRKLSKKRAN